MAVTLTTETTTAYTATESGTMVAVGTTVDHYKVPYVEGMLGADLLAAMVAEEVVRDGILVTYLPHEDVFDITVPVPTPPEMGGPLPPLTSDLETVYADYIAGL